MNGPSDTSDKLPLNFRSHETNEIISHLRAGESCQVIGIGSVGKSNLLRFLQQQDVRHAKLAAGWEKYLFIYVDTNKFLEHSEWGLWELMLHQMLVEFSNNGNEPTIAREIELLHQNATAPATRHIALRYLDRAISLLCKNLGRKLVFLFDEFDDLYRTLPSHVFDALRALRDDNKYLLMYVIAVRKDLHQLRSDGEYREAFEELVTPNTIWLVAYSKADARYTLQRLASRHKVKLSEKQIRRILEVTGGHPGLIRAVFPLISEQSDCATASLLADPHILEECRRIWRSLAKEEQKTLALLVKNGHARVSDAIFVQLRQKGLVGGEFAEAGQVFSSLLSAYILREKPAVGNRIRIDRQTQVVWVDDHKIQDIPRLEYKLLEYLEKRRGQVCTRKQIVQHLYPDEKLSGVSDNAVEFDCKTSAKEDRNRHQYPPIYRHSSWDWLSPCRWRGC